MIKKYYAKVYYKNNFHIDINYGIREFDFSLDYDGPFYSFDYFENSKYSTSK